MLHGRQNKSTALPRMGRNEPPIRIFESDRLERLTLISLGTFLAAWLPIATAQLAFAAYCATSAMVTIALIFMGLLVWFVFEYVMHRFLFHLKTTNRHLNALVWMMHTNHHVQPSHRLRTLMPLSVSLPLALLFETVSLVMFGKPWGSSLMAGFILGYVLYDLTHYACHNFAMKSRIASRIKRHHLRHHFVSDDRNFAITLPVMDSLFATRD